MGERNLTEAQRMVLVAMGDGPSLRESDELPSPWYLEGGPVVYAPTARALVRMGMVEYCAKWGGHPGILGYRISDAGRAALALEALPDTNGKDRDHG